MHRKFEIILATCQYISPNIRSLWNQNISFDKWENMDVYGSVWHESEGQAGTEKNEEKACGVI